MGGESSPTPGSPSGIRVTLLGGFRVSVGERRVPEAWRLRKAKSLVKLLSLSADHRLHREAVIATLWPDLAPDPAINNLHQALHAARRVLGSAGASGQVLRLKDDLLAFCPDGGLGTDVDELVALSHRALASGRADECRAALRGYAGELLPEDRYEDWVLPHRERLGALRSALQQRLATALLDSGEAEEAVRLLTPLAAQNPTDEPCHRLLMQALDAAGRRWDALDAYDRLRRTLEDEFAASPEPATVQLHRQLLAGRFGTPAKVSTNLPSGRSAFIGRRRELTELPAVVDRTGLLTLSGPGGVGKTRLAIELARRMTSPLEYPDGVWMVDLSGLRDGALVPATLATTLGLATGTTTPTAQMVANQLADRRCVVVLDNCEHLLDASAALAQAILDDCPEVTVVATSREPLHLVGERVWRVPSLSLPDAKAVSDPEALARHDSVQLFLRRAWDVAPHFRLDRATAGPVARICLRLDGMPLAIELAAARVAHVAPAQLAGTLDDALATLATRTRGVPDRQATLAATLDWSHNLLDDDERLVFRRLSVFAGGLTLEAAEQVCAGGLSRPVSDVLAGLVDKSLIVADTAQRLEARFRLLEVVRQYAGERLRAHGETPERKRAHALWYTERARSLDPERGGPVAGEPSPWFAMEHENLRLALDTALHEAPGHALAASVAAWRAWMAQGRHAEGFQWLSRALARSSEQSDLFDRALFATAVFEVRLGRAWRLPQLGAQIAQLATPAADPVRTAEAVHQQALLTWLAGEWERTDELLGGLDARLGDVPGILAAHHHLAALLALSRSDPVAARIALRDSIAALAGVSPDTSAFFSVCSLAYSVGLHGELFFPVFEETMIAGRRVGVAQARGYLWTTLSLAERMAGDFGSAAAALDQARRSFTALGDRAGEAHVLVQRGHLLREMGRPDIGRAAFQSAVDLWTAISDQRGTAMALIGLAVAEATAGNAAAARALAGEGGRLLDGSGDLPGQSGVLDNLAAVEVLSDELGRAADAVEQALSLGAVPASYRSVGWQHTLLAGLRNRLGDRPGAQAELDAAVAVFEQIGERRGLDATASVAARLQGAQGRRGAKRMQSGPAKDRGHQPSTSGRRVR